MYKRLELHNHTTESDASISIAELIDCMLEDKVDAFALTDHNTISGHAKAHAIIKNKKLPIECIYGMEYTTYYGHILCFNFHTYIPWENINKQKPELLFNQLRKKGALTGIAHPFSYGAPIAQGCRWEMDISDFTAFDFIELINNSDPLQEVNKPAILWWESLCLQGYKLAMTSGMDLHGIKNMAGSFATYVKTKKNEPITLALERAITTAQTHITRGPVFYTKLSADKTQIKSLISDCIKPGFSIGNVESWTIEYISPKDKIYRTIPAQTFAGRQKKLCSLNCGEFTDTSVIISKLYAGTVKLENLVAIAPTLYA